MSAQIIALYISTIYLKLIKALPSYLFPCHIDFMEAVVESEHALDKIVGTDSE